MQEEKDNTVKSYGTQLPKVSAELERDEVLQDETPKLTRMQKFKKFMKRHGPLIWRATLLIGIIIFFAVLVSLLTKYGVMVKVLNWVDKTGFNSNF